MHSSPRPSRERYSTSHQALLYLYAPRFNPRASANVLMCLDDLASVGGDEVMPYVPDLMQVIIAKPTDPSLQKRDATLHTSDSCAPARDT